MNMSRYQITMLATGGAALVVSAALGVLAFSAYSAKSEAAEAAEGDSAAVRSLLGSAISPDAASVAAINKNRDALAGWTEAAISTASAGDRKIDADVNEAALKQKLVDEARTMAALPGGVDGRIMKDVSAFGFPEFVTGDKLPEKDQLPRLQRLWGDVCTLVETLSDCGVVEIVRIAPAVAKQPDPAAEAKESRGSRNRRRKDAAEEKPAYTEEKYSIEFRAKPAALVKVVNALATSQRFVVLDSIDFAREGDMIGKALGEGEKRGADEKQSAKPRRRRRSEAEQEFGEAAAAEDADNGIVNDPAKEAPFLVKATVSTYDFGFAAQASAGGNQEAMPDEGEGAKAKEGEE